MENLALRVSSGTFVIRLVVLSPFQECARSCVPLERGFESGVELVCFKLENLSIYKRRTIRRSPRTT